MGVKGSTECLLGFPNMCLLVCTPDKLLSAWHEPSISNLDTSRAWSLQQMTTISRATPRPYLSLRFEVVQRRLQLYPFCFPGLPFLLHLCM